MTQKIRPSQFVTTYGPGSILELPDGPVIIPSADIGLFDENSSFKVEDYKIHDDRMSKGVLKGANIFSLPTNAEEGLDGEVAIYRTKSFPEWKLCLNHNNHPDHVDILYNHIERNDVVCPFCRKNWDNPDQWPWPPGAAIRFVTVCKEGHLDDVDWDYLLHGANNCSQSNIGNVDPKLRNNNAFFWKSTAGSALKDISIECPRCGITKNFATLYYNDKLFCTARNPESETLHQHPLRKRNCRSNAKIMQRQAANIRMPEIRTLLSIQSVMTTLHKLIQDDKITPAIKFTLNEINSEGKTDQKIDTEDRFKILFKNMQILDVPEKIIQKFRGESLQTRVEVMENYAKDIPNGYHELILDEFNELNKSSVYGAPPPAFKSKQTPLFVVKKEKIENFTAKNGNKFVVTPINVLQTISVQTGFKRDDTGDDLLQSESKLVESSFTDDKQNVWYPGVSYTGEGIFIRLDEDNALSNILQGDNVIEWDKAHHEETHPSGNPAYSRFLFRDADNSKDELHSGFVWWHTLSHLLIRIISEECGYSSSSIRERIYFKRDGNKIDGGILLYAAQPGSEGTLGGLTALVPHFGSFLNTVLEKVTSCSADPLCADDLFKHKKANGACCFGCLMNSETSCEHRNMWLDRNVLRDSIP